MRKGIIMLALLMGLTVIGCDTQNAVDSTVSLSSIKSRNDVNFDYSAYMSSPAFASLSSSQQNIVYTNCLIDPDEAPDFYCVNAHANQIISGGNTSGGSNPCQSILDLITFYSNRIGDYTNDPDNPALAYFQQQRAFAYYGYDNCRSQYGLPN